MRLTRRRPATPFPSDNLPDTRLCHECQRVLPLERFVRIVDGNAQVLLRCDECEREIPKREEAERLKREINKNRAEALSDMLKRLDVKSYDAPITQEVWARLVVAMGGIDGVVGFIRERISNAESESQRIKACELLIKLGNASTQFDQMRKPLDKVSDEELNAELVNLLRGLPSDVRRELLAESEDEAEADVGDGGP